MAKTGRPLIPIDLEQAEKLGHLQCTLEECSAWLNVKVSTLSNRKDFLESYKKGKESGKASLRRMQFKLAEKSAAMAIWLGKQYLGQKDMEYQQPGTETIDFEFTEIHEDKS